MRGVTDQYRGTPAEVRPIPSGGVLACDGHEVGADLAHLAVRADVEVEMVRQAEGAELHPSERSDVAGQQRLNHGAVGRPVGQRSDGLARTRQHGALRTHHADQFWRARGQCLVEARQLSRCVHACG